MHERRTMTRPSALLLLSLGLLLALGPAPSRAGSPSFPRPFFGIGLRAGSGSVPPSSSIPPTLNFDAVVADVAAAASSGGGGGASGSPLFRIETSTDALVHLFGLAAAINGSLLAVSPRLGRRLAGTAVDEDDSVAVYAETAVGCHSLEYGLTGYLAATGLASSPALAAAYGALVDLGFLAKHLADGTYRGSSGAGRGIMAALAAGSALAVATVLGDGLLLPIPAVSPEFALGVLTAVSASQGLLAYFAPARAARAVLGADAAGGANPASAALCRRAGQTKLATSVLRAGLLAGAGPVRALACSVLASAALTADSIVVRTVHRVAAAGGGTGAEGAGGGTEAGTGAGGRGALYRKLGSLAVSLAVGAALFLAEE
jgi:hypothetical protein